LTCVGDARDERRWVDDLAEDGILNARSGELNRNDGFKWADAFLDYPYRAPAKSGPILQVAVQERHPTQKNRSSFKPKLGLDGKPFEHGIGGHADSSSRAQFD
jgi:hypothetical protein